MPPSNLGQSRFAAFRSQSFLLFPSYPWIVSGASGLTSLMSGCTITAPSIWCWCVALPSLCSFTWHDSLWTVGDEKYPVPSSDNREAPAWKANGSNALPRCNRRNTSPKNGPQVLGVQRVENLPHPRVAGNLADAEQRLEILVAATVVEGQQRGVLQREQSEGRKQRVGQGNRRARPSRIGDLGKSVANQGIEGIRRRAPTRS